MYNNKPEMNEIQSPLSPPIGSNLLIREETKTTEYLIENTMSPKLNLKAVGVEYLPVERDSYYRNT